MSDASLGHRTEAGGPSAAPLQVAPAGGVAAANRVAPLSAYVPRIALQWMADSPDERHRAIEGSLAFVDVSGFTALTERLAARGRAGAEEINDIIGSTFTELARLAAHDGADLLKWGGDAALLLFEGPSSAERAARSAWRMVAAMQRAGRLRTSAGRVALHVSVGVHSGRLELFLLGELHRELIVAGPGATSTAEMEATAAAGEVVVSLSTAALLAAAGEDAVLGERKGDGIVLRDEPRPRGDWGSPVLLRADGDEAALLMPERTRRHLLAGGEQAEHRPVAVGFVQVSGLDAVLEERGPQGVVELLDPLVRVAEDAAERHRASFHATDLSPDGVKIILLGGVPTLHGDDADRLVRTALEIRDRSVAPDGGRALDGRRSLSVRAGVNAGKVFVFASDFGLGGRRIYSLTGDVVNLAARVAAASSPGEVRCTEATRDTLRSPFSLSEMPPFRAKGKAEPVVTYAVGEVVGWRPAGASAGRSGGAPAGFLGRERGPESLLEAAETTRRGPTGLAVELVGPAGIGKTRLVDEAAARWRLPTARIAGDSFGLARPYRALRPFARRLLMLDDDAPPGRVAESLRATLERHAPSLLSWAPLVADVLDVSLSPTTEVEELDPRFRRRRLEAAFVELLASLLSGPTALVFEDVHGLDEASASLATRIAEEASLRPWLVVATRRPDGPGVPPGVLDDRIVIELGPLDAASSGRLLGGLASEALRPGERELLVERAAGNPLFLLELGRAAAASGSVEDLPDGLEPLLASQIDRLIPEERLVLRSAAVLGLRFDEQLLGDLLDDASLLDGGIWERLGEFIRPESGVRVFRHALLRDAAYEGLSFRRRRQLHARAASAIEVRASHLGDAAELLSLHWLAAEQWQPAWDCARLAGEHAAALYANRDAATHFRRALAAARHLRHLDRSEIATVAERLGDVSWLSGAYGQARAAYLTARRGARGEVARARLLRQLGLLHARQGGLAQALRCFTLARRQLRAGVDSPGAPCAPGADAAGPERSELARAAANVLHRQGRLHDSMAFAEVAEREADASGYRLGLAKALNTQYINTVFLNEARDELGERALSIFVEVGDIPGQGLVLNHLGISAFHRGDWDEALRYYSAARDAQARAGDLVEQAIADNNTAEILADQGRLNEAEQRLEDARAACQAARFPVGTAVATMNLGRLATRRGDYAEAMSLLTAARSLLEAVRADTYLAEVELRLLECDLARGELALVAASASELVTRLAGRPGHERVHAGALRLVGVARARLGDPDAATQLDEAVTRWRTLGDRFELAQSLLARAGLARRTGSAERAAPDEAEASQLFDRLGILMPARGTFA